MKVSDIINDLIATKAPSEKTFPFEMCLENNETIYGEELRQFKDKLMECDEFKECELLEFLPLPIIQNKEGKPISAQNVLVGKGVKFKGRCFLLSIALIPTIYDPKTMYEPVKDGATLTPIMYSPIDITPYRKLVLPWGVEGQDNDLPLKKAELYNLINKILKNPEEYMTQGTRKIMIRGIFETIETNENKIQSEHNLDINVNEPPLYSQVFYLHYDRVEGTTDEINMTIKSKAIHNSLKEKFLKQFEGKSLIMEGELNKFLEENGATNGD